MFPENCDIACVCVGIVMFIATIITMSVEKKYNVVYVVLLIISLSIILIGSIINRINRCCSVKYYLEDESRNIYSQDK